MSNINQITKKDYNAIELDYTSKDYATILDDLINSIPGITQKWKSSDENDPGMILVKLMAMVGDLLFYNQDRLSLEVYPSSVTQRKNAASIYKLIGYKMRWYRSASLQANLVNTYSNGATIPRFCTFTNETGDITYSTFSQYELPSNTDNNGLETLITLIQGNPVTPVRVSSSPYPEAGRPWHSIYGYNYSTDDIINNRIYLKDTNIDQDHIILIDDQNDEWAIKDNIYLTTAVGKFFEFGVDVNDVPYLELIDYYGNYNIKKFKVFYLKSLGENGQIYANTLKRMTGNAWSRASTGGNLTIYNVSNFIHFTHYNSTLGYDPETPDEARKESVKYQNTLDTLITLADFERATLREYGVANVRATDLTNDPGESVTFYVGDINQDTYIDENDYELLENYLADPIGHPLTTYQMRLADCNQDGVVNTDDLQCLNDYLVTEQQPGQEYNSGYVGIRTLSNINLLPGFVVKLYILRTPEAEQAAEDESFKAMIRSDLQEYKVLPLSIEVDLNSIVKYYWTVEGKFLTKSPLSKDELQTIIVNINNTLRFKYSVDKINFNSLISYKEVIETILSVDSRILMVDLEPITYRDYENEIISKEEITGNYNQVIPKLENPNPEDNLLYNFILDNPPILPGSLIIKINEGQYTLRDNNNGYILNTDNILARKGTINYLTGAVQLEFNAPVTFDIIVEYTQNKTTILTYKNLSTQTFYYDPSSLRKDEIQDTI